MTELQTITIINNLFCLGLLLILLLFITLWIRWGIKANKDKQDKDKEIKKNKTLSRRELNQQIIDKYLK